MVLEVDGTSIVSARGDREHPISRGYLCPKGRSAGHFHHHSDRLDYTLVDGGQSNWDATLDDLAARMRSIIARNGPEAIGYYTASG
jgi:anaerobic selenocysteine-containing dehydrogenase